MRYVWGTPWRTLKRQCQGSGFPAFIAGSVKDSNQEKDKLRGQVEITPRGGGHERVTGCASWDPPLADPKLRSDEGNSLGKTPVNESTLVLAEMR